MDQSDSRTRSTMSGATAMMKASNSGEERDHELGSRPTSIQIAPPPPPTTTPILSSAPHQQQQQPGPSSSGSIVESSSSTILPLRFSHHQPSIASPLRTAIRPHFSSTGSDESTPTASPSTSSEALQAERFLSYSMTTPTRPTENLYRSKSHLDESSGEGSASSSGNVTPTSYPLPLHHHPYQTPSSSSIEQRRHSDTEHLSVRMSDGSSSSHWIAPSPSAQQLQSRLAPIAGSDNNLELRRSELAGTGFLNTPYFPSSGAVATGVGGYASSVDGDYHSQPPSRLVSRTPTPVLNANQGLTSSTATSVSGLRPSSPEFTNSTATESDEDDSDYLSAPGWGSAREVASIFGFSSKQPSHARSGGKRYQGIQTRKGSKWQDQPDTPVMESQRSFRGKERSKGYEMSNHLGHASSGLLDQRSGRSNRRKKQSSTSKIPWPFRVISSLLFKTFRTLFGPIHPLTIMVALALIAGFVTAVTMLIIYILNPDKEPLPWRTYCQQQMPFPHAYADALAPVNVFVGVVTTDSKFERRNIIRQTYAKHTLPVDINNNPTANVQVKFILGKVRSSHARRVALEMETFNDIVVLDLEETQSARKTHAFMKWAAENATVPVLRPVGSDWSNVDTTVPNPAFPGGLSDWHQDDTVNDANQQRYQLGWKKVDYVVKADDDSFIVLDELERHLRVAPRKMTYWGYLIKNWFMGGEAYALSFDLVEWIAHSPDVARTAKGKEDTRTPQWIALHSNRSSINWVSEHCWIYDHPKGGSPYSHGFLFPDYVEKIKLEARYGLSEQEIAYRGGEKASQSYSTVTKWHQKYIGPRRDLTVEEEVEALIEGGGRWAGTWVRSEGRNDAESWVPYEDIVYGNNDARLAPSVTNDKGSSVMADDVGWEPSSGLFVYGIVEGSNNSSSDQNMIKSRDLLADLSGLPGNLLGDGHPKKKVAIVSASPLQASSNQDASHYRPHLLPRPTHKDGNGEYASLRSQRYLHRPHGGTVVVHYLKKTEWWLETALALSGKPKMWTNGAGGKGKEWRMGGSPLVRSDGYIFQGRSQPLPMDADRVAPADQISPSTAAAAAAAARAATSKATTLNEQKDVNVYQMKRSQYSRRQKEQVIPK